MDEARRHQLRRSLAETIGDEAADLLMSQLPPYPWHDLVTRDVLRHELERFEARLDYRFAQIDSRFAEVDRRFAEIEGRFGEVEGRFGQIDRRFGEMEARFGEMEARFGEMEARFGELQLAIARQTWIMTTAIVAAVAGSVGVTATLV